MTRSPLVQIVRPLAHRSFAKQRLAVGFLLAVGLLAVACTPPGSQSTPTPEPTPTGTSPAVPTSTARAQQTRVPATVTASTLTPESSTPSPPTNTAVPPVSPPFTPTATNTPIAPVHPTFTPTATKTPVPPFSVDFTPTATKTPIPPVSVDFTPTVTNTPIGPFSIAFLPGLAADPPGVVYEPGGQVTLCYDLETDPPTPPSSYSVSLFKVAAGEQVHLGDYEDDGTGGCVQVNLTGDETGQIVYLMVFFVDGFPVAQAQTFVEVEAP